MMRLRGGKEERTQEKVEDILARMLKADGETIKQAEEDMDSISSEPRTAKALLDCVLSRSAPLEHRQLAAISCLDAASKCDLQRLQIMRRDLAQSWEAMTEAQRKSIQDLVSDGLVHDVAFPHQSLRREIALLVGAVTSLASTFFDVDAVLNK
eukprot:2378043-Rhodomonas_salina.1